MRRPRLLLSLLVGLLLVPWTTNAQSAQARKDSLRQLREDIAIHMDRIHHADSVGDARDAARWRIMLAGFIQPSKRQKLLEEAVAIADSADLLEEELRARTGLMNALRAAGHLRRAYDEAQLVIALTAQREQEEAARYTEIEKWHTDSALTARDSIERDLQQVLKEARHRESHMEAAAEQLFFSLVGVVLTAAAVIIVLLLRSTSRTKRFRYELQALRAEVAELQKPRNTYRPADAAQASAPAPIAVVEVAPSPLRLPDDALATGMFLRSAPERLSTFKEARARGDLEKAVRVVHTLKPLLASIDTDRFAPLCARLVASGAAGGDAWNADADELIAMVEALLAQR